jgi:hypothetical protein
MEILKTMNAKISHEASGVIDLPYGITTGEILKDSIIKGQLDALLLSFANTFPELNSLWRKV